MKKEYIKPELNEIKVEANQSVAACQIFYTGFKCNGDRSGKTGFTTPEGAWYDSACGIQPHGHGIVDENGNGTGLFEYDPVNTTPNTHMNHWVFPTYGVSGTLESGEPFEVYVDDTNWDNRLQSGENHDQTNDIVWSLVGQKPNSDIAGILS